MFVGPSKELELGMGEEWGWPHSPPGGIEQASVAALHSNCWERTCAAGELGSAAEPGSRRRPHKAELGAWETGISRPRAKTGRLEGCVGSGMGSCVGGGQGLEDPAFEEWGVLRLALDSDHQICCLHRTSQGEAEGQFLNAGIRKRK